MKWTNLIPGFAKPMLRPVYRKYQGMLERMIKQQKSREELYGYWKEPWDGVNLPHQYLGRKARSQFLVDIIKRYVSPGKSILEIGCNVGRNLSFLYLAGYKDLSGIEISENAVILMRESYPELARHCTIYNAPVEKKIKDFMDGEFHVVFTMAVLEHIHTESEWVFAEMSRVARSFLITIEDEHTRTWRHFPRNYRQVFESLGMRQVEEINCRDVTELGSNFVARIFVP